MKKLSLLVIILFCSLVLACKEKKSEQFLLLTTPTWTTDTLLANGVDASGPDQLLGKFKGDAKFKEDGTGVFGTYTGKWSFSNAEETKLTITSPSLKIPIVCNLIELTSASLKIKTAVFDSVTFDPINIRMTFKAK